MPLPAAPLTQPAISFAWSALSAFSIISSTGLSSAPLAFCLINSITLRKIAHSSGSRLPGVRTLSVLFPNRREIGQELFRDSRPGSRPHARHRRY